MVPQVISAEARRRSEDAVRRIREESRLRVAGRRHRSCFSWCMLASLAGGLSLAAVDAYDMRHQEQRVERAAAEARARERAEIVAAFEAQRKARIAEACAKRELGLLQIDEITIATVAKARSGKERVRARAEGLARRTALIEATAGAGCGEPSAPRTASIRDAERFCKDHSDCGGPRHSGPGRSRRGS